jgi:hypothetical protein
MYDLAQCKGFLVSIERVALDRTIVAGVEQHIDQLDKVLCRQETQRIDIGQLDCERFAELPEGNHVERKGDVPSPAEPPQCLDIHTVQVPTIPINETDHPISKTIPSSLKQ